MKRMFVLLFIVIFSGCKENINSTTPSGAYTLAVIQNGVLSNVPECTNNNSYVAKYCDSRVISAENFETFKAICDSFKFRLSVDSIKPFLDFSRSTVLFVFAGIKSSTCYYITLKSSYTISDSVYLTAMETHPSDTCGCGEAITFPYVMAIVEKSGKAPALSKSITYNCNQYPSGFVPN